MGIEYQICIRAKNEDWYLAAARYPSVKHWEEWDDGRTPRYVREVQFEFNLPILSVAKKEYTSFEIQLFHNDGSSSSIILGELRVINFKGEADAAHLIVSESLIDQVIFQKHKGRKTYLYCYIKENAEFFMMTEFIWLSAEHWERVKSEIKPDTYLKGPELNLKISAGLIGSFHEPISNEYDTNSLSSI